MPKGSFGRGALRNDHLCATISDRYDSCRCTQRPFPFKSRARFERILVMAIIGWIVFGLVVGIIARFLMPGPQPMGFILTAVLGVAGSFLGGYLGTLIHGGAMD